MDGATELGVGFSAKGAWSDALLTARKRKDRPKSSHAATSSKPAIDTTLDERGTKYGEYATHAYITQAMKRAMADSPNWSALAVDMKEALEMVAHKIGRILNGDPDYIDSWHDIIGYVRLVEQRLIKEQAADDGDSRA
jgi:hypothetical protein